MSYTGTTDKLKLPQFINTDTFNICGDLNGAFKKIDDNAIENENEISLLKTNEENNATGIQELNNTVSELRGDVQAISETLGATNETVTTLNRHLNDLETEIESLQGLNLEEVATQVETNTSNISKKVTTISISQLYVDISDFKQCSGKLSKRGDEEGKTAFQFTVTLPVSVKHSDIVEFNPFISVVDGNPIENVRYYVNSSAPDTIFIFGTMIGQPTSMGKLTSMTGKLYFRKLNISR